MLAGLIIAELKLIFCTLFLHLSLIVSFFGSLQTLRVIPAPLSSRVLISDPGDVFPLCCPLVSHQLLHLTVISLIWIPGMVLRGLFLTYTLAYSHYGAHLIDL